MGDNDVTVLDGSEVLDQLQPDDTLVDRGVADTLDEGYVTAEKWSVAVGYGNTIEEMRRGAPLDMRLAQEEPDLADDGDDDWNPEGERRECGDRRAGRLVDPHGDYDDEPEAWGHDVGIDGGAASAEEAAMHVFDPNLVDDEL